MNRLKIGFLWIRRCHLFLGLGVNYVIFFVCDEFVTGFAGNLREGKWVCGLECENDASGFFMVIDAR